MPARATKIWERVLVSLKDKVHEQSFNTWLRPTKGGSLADGQLKIHVPNPFYAEWLGEHYSHLIEESVEEIIGRKVELVYEPVVKVGSGAKRIRPAQQNTFSARQSQLQERFSFKNFVVGKGNQFAHAAALAVAESPGKTYNPLFIYGGTGLGKTHLSQAIGNFVKEQDAGRRVYYTAAEKFMNEMIYAIQNRKTIEFKNKYRSKDLLILDDIHFLADKESLQEEIFHTFNSLYGAGRQIVMTSDRPPKDIPSLQERLLSRFQWGLVVDIKPPDLETRIAILKNKAERDGIEIPDEVSYYIAENVKSNVRELEGSLIRLLAYSSLTGREMNVETAREVLKEIVGPERPRITAEGIQRVVADYFDLSEDAIRGKRRTASVALSRQIAMYLCRELTDLSLKEIGVRFGGKDHTTILHAHEKVKRVSAQDPQLRSALEKLIHTIQGE
ncbi:MAG: chromosomal replication initiator protein DnaA [bacterium]